ADPLGDYNRDGTVDAADYVVWRKTLGRNGLALAADGDANGLVNNADYNIWRAHFGQSVGGGAALPSAHPPLASVPEPNGSSLLLSAAFATVLGYAAVRRRRNAGWFCSTQKRISTPANLIPSKLIKLLTRRRPGTGWRRFVLVALFSIAGL